MHLLIFVQAANAGKASVKVLNSLGPGMPFFQQGQNQGQMLAGDSLLRQGLSPETGNIWLLLTICCPFLAGPLFVYLHFRCSLYEVKTFC